MDNATADKGQNKMANALIYHLLNSNGTGRPKPACKQPRATMAMTYADFLANPEVTMCEKCRASKAYAAMVKKYGEIK